MGKKNIYFQPLKKHLALGFRHPKLLVQHFPCVSFTQLALHQKPPSISRHFTICAVAWATFCGLPWALAATKPGQSTTSRLGAWHRGWVADRSLEGKSVPNIWRCFHGKSRRFLWMAFLWVALEITSRKQIEAQKQIMLGRNIELRHREKTFNSQSPMWCLIPNATQFAKIYQVILGKLAGDLDMTWFLSRVTIPALFWKTQFMADYPQSPSSCSVLLICSTLWKITIPSHFTQH